MACHDAKAADAACRNGKCDDGRVIARDKIAAAGGKGPLFFFTKFRKTVGFQRVCHVLYRMETAGARV